MGGMAYHIAFADTQRDYEKKSYKGLYWSFQWCGYGYQRLRKSSLEIPSMAGLTLQKLAIIATTRVSFA